VDAASDPEAVALTVAAIREPRAPLAANLVARRQEEFLHDEMSTQDVRYHVETPQSTEQYKLAQRRSLVDRRKSGRKRGRLPIRDDTVHVDVAFEDGIYDMNGATLEEAIRNFRVPRRS
jgi:hypothetical protein